MKYDKETMNQIRHMVVVVSAEKEGNIELSMAAKKRLSEIKKKRKNGKNGKRNF